MAGRPLRTARGRGVPVAPGTAPLSNNACTVDVANAVRYVALPGGRLNVAQLLRRPDVIRDVHAAMIAAGAEVLETLVQRAALGS